MPANMGSSLGDFLRSRRARLDPASLGYTGRRRTTGLRREEVAQRANISPTWYTWLEQGRGGAPSAAVLKRISSALMLTQSEHEHLYMLALGRPPEVHYTPVEGINPRLQRVLDSLPASPAIIKSATWDIIAWNRAAAVVLTDYSTLPVGQRNILRFLFCDPAVRAGLVSEVSELVDELCTVSPEFAALWRHHEVHGYAEGESVKRLLHPELGHIELEHSAFSIDGRPDLGMIVYTPLNDSTAEKIKALVERA